jgi:Uma2 family endonuclease
MSAVIAPDKDLTLNFGSLMPKFSDEEYAEFCRQNPDLRIERTAEGDLIIMPPTGGKSGAQNFYLTGKFSAWVEKDGTGKGFDSSTEFSLPNGAKRMPDVSWIRNERWNALSEEQRIQFPPLCPDFIIELRSPSDRLKILQDKMEEYIANGAQLGWLFDPIDKKIYVYRPDATVEVLDNPKETSGEPLLKGFTVDVQALWAAGE